MTSQFRQYFTEEFDNFNIQEDNDNVTLSLTREEANAIHAILQGEGFDETVWSPVRSQLDEIASAAIPLAARVGTAAAGRGAASTAAKTAGGTAAGSGTGATATGAAAGAVTDLPGGNALDTVNSINDVASDLTGVPTPSDVKDKVSGVVSQAYKNLTTAQPLPKKVDPQ